MKRWLGPTISGVVTAGFAYGAASSSGWAMFWFTLLAIGGAGETVALTQRAKGDTFSETVWSTTDERWPRVALALFMAWLSWHFVGQRRPNEGKDSEQ